MPPPRKRAKLCVPISEDTTAIAALPSPISEQQDIPAYFESASERIKRRRAEKAFSIADEIQAELEASYQIEAKQAPTPPEAILENRAAQDQAFAQAVLTECDELRKDHDNNIGLRQLERVSALLRKATRATQEEGPWLTAPEAAEYVRPGRLHRGPIFVEDQQPHSLVTVEDFVDEFYDDSATIWIQDAGAAAAHGTTRELPVGEVKKRLAGPSSRYPWNCLELACPIEDGIRPRFLNTPECRLLTKIKVPHAEAGMQVMKAGRRQLTPGYKEAEKWVLLAEAGSLTEPHQDSHGFNTFITVNDGQLGFGWLHQPKRKEHQAWLNKPESFRGSTWRYVVLRPGQTVYFPAGTVHFVFRLRSAGHTLAFGGFVLRCSTILPWVEALLDERNHPYITNEELTTATISYLDQVEKFVLQAKASGNQTDIDRWGGSTAIDKFLKHMRAYKGPQKVKQPVIQQ